MTASDPLKPGETNPHHHLAAPRHPQATLALVFGIVGIVGCQLFGPFAWYLGSRAVKEIDSGDLPLSGRSDANAGRILGIISSALMGVVAVLVVAVAVSLSVSIPEFAPTRWWARRIADQVDGGSAAGALWGVVYGGVALLVTIAILRWAIRRDRKLVPGVGAAALGLVLLTPTWLTLMVALGSGSGASAGQRILDVEAPNFVSAWSWSSLAVALGAIVYLAAAKKSTRSP